MNETDKRKDIVQDQAVNAILSYGGNPIRAIIEMATGVGKSKTIIKYILKKVYYGKKILLVVPTVKLRDNNWKNEFSKWGYNYLYENIDRECYASINKIENKHYDLVILDELQNITPNNYEFFEKNTVIDVVGLSATVPTEHEKSELLKRLNMKVVFKMPLDEAVEKELVSEYNIVKVEFRLNNIHKNVEAGSIKNRFMTTEQSNYDYLTSDIEISQHNPRVTAEKMKFKYLRRMRFLYDLQTRELVAKEILKKIPQEERTIIFAGTIKMAESLEKNTFHSKTNDQHLKDFIDKKINRLSSVKALNEGINIPDVDNAVIVVVNSKERHLIQKIGRAIRRRDGKIAKIYICYAKGTVDERWVEQATKNLDLSNVKTIKFSVK